MEKRKRSFKKYAVSVASVVVYVLTGGLAILPMMLALMRRSRDEEVAVGVNMVATCLIAGVIMAVARPLADWITGGKLTSPNAPPELVDMINRVFDLVMYIGVAMLVLGLIMAGINMTRQPEASRKKSG